MAFLDGRPLEGFLHNPLLFLTSGLGGVLLVLRIAFARGISIQLTTRERRATYVSGLVLLTANWLYVALYVR